MNFKIGNKIIGKKRVFVIAEIGVNHNGSLPVCKNLIKQAKISGADAVKLQIINAEESYSKSTESYKIFKKNFLNYEEIKKIKIYANKLNIVLFATPGDFSSLSIIKKLNFPAIKISSGLLTNIPLIVEASKLKKPMIISTGFANLNEINEAVQNIKKYHNRIGILKCTSIYPAKNKYLNLSSINTLKKKFRYVIGYSDHSLGDLACLAAVSLGSKIIEKHFTLDKKLVGADHKISMAPKEFSIMVNKIRKIEESLGSENTFPTKEELKTRNFYRRAIVLKNIVKKGQKIKRGDLLLQRNNFKGIKLHPREYFKLIGKKSKRTIQPYKLIKKNDFF